MTDMPEKIFVRRVGKKKLSAVREESPLALGGFVAFTEARPPKPRTEYTRADLPKEVDLRSLYLNEQNGGAAVALAQGVKCAASYNKAIDHLVALGVIRDRGE